jgi:spore maturation protein CgeB
VPAPGPTLVELVRTSPQLRRRLAKRRFATPDLDVLLLDARYHLVGELRRALEAFGHRVWSVPVEDDAEAMMRSVLGALAAHPPDFVLTVNHLGFDAGGALGEVLSALEVPVAAWYVDSPMFVLRGGPVPAADTSIVFTWERTLVPTLKTEVDARWLPLATDPSLFAAKDHAPSRSEIAFVGNSGQGAQEKWRARVDASDEPTIRRLEAVIAKGGAEVLTDPSVREDPLHADRVAAATWRANTRLRADFLRRFDPGELLVLGDAGWEDHLPEARLAPGPPYGAALAEVYRAHPVQLNITSLQMPTAVNQRVFDVPAAGGFVLTDRRQDLESLFAEDEMATWSSFDEAVDKARFYVRHPERRQKLAARARHRVLAEHTYQHRVATVLAALRGRFGHTPRVVSAG